jgi:hypothetical protein
MISPIQLSPSMDTATLVSAINDMFRQVESENRTKVVKDETGTNRILIGRGEDGKYYLKVSKDGVNVMEASDADLVFNSANNLFKIKTTDTITLNRPAGTSSVSTDIPIPDDGVLLCWATLTNGSPSLTFQVPYFSMSGSGQAMWGVRAFFDTQVGIVRIFNDAYDAGVIAQAYNMSIKYYILQETVV